MDEGARFQVVGGLTGIAAGFAVRKLVRSVWTAGTGKEPPANPAAPGTTWTEALTWALVSGALIAVGRMVAQRGAAEAWKSRVGSYPPGLDDVSA
jgi:hypothetical protein